MSSRQPNRFMTPEDYSPSATAYRDFPRTGLDAEILGLRNVNSDTDFKNLSRRKQVAVVKFDHILLLKDCRDPRIRPSYDQLCRLPIRDAAEEVRAWARRPGALAWYSSVMGAAAVAIEALDGVREAARNRADPLNKVNQPWRRG